VFTAYYLSAVHDKSMKKPYKDFDLPTQHLSVDHHYIPSRARSSGEIERRHELPRGTILAEYKEKGTKVAAHILHSIQYEPDVVFSSKILAATGLNSSWYEYARGASVMRRRLKLPVLAEAEGQLRLNMTDILEDARASFDGAAYLAGRVVAAHEHRSPKLPEHKILLGKGLGSASLTLACANMNKTPAYDTPFVVQTVVREQGLQALQDARALSSEIGTPPSLAQLADPNSDLSVYIRRNAPDGVYQAYDEALELHAVRV
jgi:hypothetical protein